MHSPSTIRRALVAGGATICLLSAAAVAVAMGGTGTTAPVHVAAVTDIAPEVTTPPTTAAPSTTSTSTSTSTSTTSTTVKPRPTTTVPPVRVTVPVTAPPATTPPAPAAAPASSSPGDRCRAALQFAADHGVLLPAGWGFRCPGSTNVDSGGDHWGLACFNCEGTGSWIAVDVGRVGASDATLRYVVAHETCHAIDYATLGVTTEVGADLCAALHGAPRP
jgi:hypothetical protein